MQKCNLIFPEDALFSPLQKTLDLATSRQLSHFWLKHTLFGVRVQIPSPPRPHPSATLTAGSRFLKACLQPAPGWLIWCLALASTASPSVVLVSGPLAWVILLHAQAFSDLRGTVGRGLGPAHFLSCSEAVLGPTCPDLPSAGWPRGHLRTTELL